MGNAVQQKLPGDLLKSLSLIKDSGVGLGLQVNTAGTELFLRGPYTCLQDPASHSLTATQGNHPADGNLLMLCAPVQDPQVSDHLLPFSADDVIGPVIPPRPWPSAANSRFSMQALISIWA